MARTKKNTDEAVNKAVKNIHKMKNKKEEPEEVKERE